MKMSNASFPFLEHDLDHPLPQDMCGAVVAIGNFDGVHRGHQVVLQRAMDIAKNTEKRCFALSFEPHPRTLFKPESPVFRLTPAPMKARVLAGVGVDGLLVLPFTRELAGTPAETFVERYLLGHAGASHVVTGFNFHFGKGREGSPEFLKSMGEARGFGVTTVEAYGDGDCDEPISSSRIRRLLGAGDVSAAAELLGYRWTVSETVTAGHQQGRELGYPTANLVLPPSCHLAHGIYAVRFTCADGMVLNGVASHGRRPTFDNGAVWLETFVFDFDGDLYGEQVSVSLYQYLRGEEAFDSVDALVAQMDRDSAQARAIMADAEPLSPLDATLTFPKSG